MQVALSINARTAAEARDLVLRAPHIVGQGGMVHMDVHAHSFQGVLVPQGIQTEVHIMVRDFEPYLASWFKAGAFRAIIPVEYVVGDAADRARRLAARYGASIMPSFSSALGASDFLQYKAFTAFQVLAVPAGISGHAFDMRAIDMLRALRMAFPSAILEVDGGITPVIAARAKDAGADIVVSASCIWGADSPREAYNSLTRI